MKRIFLQARKKNSMRSIFPQAKKINVATHIVLVEDTPVHYWIMGEGQPIVLIHGLSGSTLWWQRNTAALAKHYRVYLVDLPGFGSMARKSKRLTLIKIASWLHKWMEAVGLKQAHLVGHSMGGYISLWLAAHHPHLVSRLILISPAVMPQVNSVFEYIVPLLASTRSLTPHFFPILLYDALRAGPSLLFRTACDLVAVHGVEEIRMINTPTLLVWGEDDSLVPLKIGTRLRQEMRNVNFLLLKRAGHVSMFDQPETFNAAALTFLQGGVVGESI
jgi:pimeloyl-ACP methyl ester carboxylesterase